MKTAEFPQKILVNMEQKKKKNTCKLTGTAVCHITWYLGSWGRKESDTTEAT